MYIISGRGRKSGVARATEATASLAPLNILLLKSVPLTHPQISNEILCPYCRKYRDCRVVHTTSKQNKMLCVFCTTIHCLKVIFNVMNNDYFFKSNIPNLGNSKYMIQAKIFSNPYPKIFRPPFPYLLNLLIE